MSSLPHHSLVRFHGWNTKGHYWYNYLYSEKELQPWIDKVHQIRKQAKILRTYFNNHYGGNRRITIQSNDWSFTEAIVQQMVLK